MHLAPARVAAVAAVGAVLSVGACSGSTTPEPTVTASSESPGLIGATDTATSTNPTGDTTGTGERIEPERSAFVSSAKVTVARVQWDDDHGLRVFGSLTNLGPVDSTLEEVLGRSPVAVEVDGARVELSHPVPRVPVGSTATFEWNGSLGSPPDDLAGGTLVVGTSDANEVRMPLSGPWTEPHPPLAHSARGVVVATQAVRATVVDSLVRPSWEQGHRGATLVDLRVGGLGLVEQYGGYRFNFDALALVDGGGNVVPGANTAGAPDFLNVLGKDKRSNGWVTFTLDTWRPPYTLRLTVPDFSPPQTASKPIALG